MHIFNKKTDRTSSRPQDTFVDRLSTDPYLDWSLFVAVAAAIIALGIIAGVYVYIETSSRLSTEAIVDSGARSIFDARVLDESIERLDRRAIIYQSAAEGTMDISSDPSL